MRSRVTMGLSFNTIGAKSNSWIFVGTELTVESERGYPTRFDEKCWDATLSFKGWLKPRAESRIVCRSSTAFLIPP